MRRRSGRLSRSDRREKGVEKVVAPLSVPDPFFRFMDRRSRVRHAQESTKFCDGEESAKELVHAFLLHLSTRLPSGEGGLGDLEQIRQFPLLQPQRLATPTDVRGCKQPGRRTEGVKEAIGGGIVEYE